MKPTTPRRTRRLLARAATMNHNAEEFEDYGPEPNMKLSHAFLVVLALHVVAVGGLYAFNTIKAGNHSTAKSEAKAGGVATKSIPAGDNGPSGSGTGGSGDQGNDRPPLESKPAPVAKVSKSSSKADSSEQSTQPAKGFLSMLKKAGIGGATAAGSSKIAAQEPASAAVTSQTDSAVPPQGYMVKSGDTVTKIASVLGVTIPELEKANGLTGNSVLQVGQILKVPSQVVTQTSSIVQKEAGKDAVSDEKPQAQNAGQAALAAAGAVPAVPSASEETAGGSQYTVVKGDSPYKIAKKFKITPDELIKANGITDPKKIQIGQVLKIPSSAAKAKTTK